MKRLRPSIYCHRPEARRDLVAYDVNSLRKHFRALEGGVAFFDGAAGTQVPDVVGHAVATTLTAGISNRGAVTAAERRADHIVLAARQSMADLLGVEPTGVVFGRSMTALTYDFSRALAKSWSPGDEVVVTRLEHDANIRPWLQAAAATGAALHWVDFDPVTGDLDPEAVSAVLSARTRLVAVTGASNLIGTRPPVAKIAASAHEVGALVYVDGVHLTPHAPVDVPALGADLYACSPYKFLGPHCGVVTGRPELLERIHPDKLLPSTEVVPERFELGTLPYELLAGTTAAVEFLAGIAPGGAASRRERILASMAAVESHEDRLGRRLETELGSVDGVQFYGLAKHRTPVVFFRVKNLPTPRNVRWPRRAGHQRPRREFLRRRGFPAPSGV
jgi:cysteine desulfurase family protein (TIGR01976 family)